jgi:ADP-ribose pyrophosphatase
LNLHFRIETQNGARQEIFLIELLESLRLRGKLYYSESAEILMNPYKTLEKKIISENPWWRYCHHQITLPSGKVGEYHFVETNGSSMIVPVTKEGRFLLVRQYRYLGDRDSLEFPCGGLKAGATFEETALHELGEETGYKPGRLQEIGQFNPCNGLINETCTVYLAENLSYIGARPDETECFELEQLTAQEIDARIKDGTIWDGMTIAAWMIAKLSF